MDEHKTSELKKWKKVQIEAKLLLPTGSISTTDVDKELYFGEEERQHLIHGQARQSNSAVWGCNPGEGWEKEHELRM